MERPALRAAWSGSAAYRCGAGPPSSTCAPAGYIPIFLWPVRAPMDHLAAYDGHSDLDLGNVIHRNGQTRTSDLSFHITANRPRW